MESGTEVSNVFPEVKVSQELLPANCGYEKDWHR